jgi:ankyrin repeat protein
LGSLRQINSGRRAQIVDISRRQIFSLIESRDLRGLDRLLDTKFSLNFCSEDGRVPILVSIQDCPRHEWRSRIEETSPVDIFRALVTRGVDPNYTPSGPDNLPLTIALLNKKGWIVKELLRLGANPEYHFEDEKWTPLCYAISNTEPVETIELMLIKGADPNVKTKAGNTSVHHAATRTNLYLFQLLEKHGANLKAENAVGQTALHLICKKNSSMASNDRQEEWDVFDFLMGAGLNINQRDAMGQTPASYVNRKSVLFPRLAACGVEINKDIGMLWDAVKRADTSLVGMLLASKKYSAVDLNDKVDGYFLLETALKTPGQSVSIIRLLVQYGADPTITTDNNVPITQEFEAMTWTLPNDLVQKVRNALRGM